MSSESSGILVVDDEYSVRDSLYHWFKKDGYRVATAENAAGALAQFAAAHFDVVLLDIKMPGMDGIELQRRLLEVAPHTTVIIITAHGTIETAVEALKNGAFDYVTKPVDPDHLSRLVQKALEHRRLQTENVRLRAKIDTLVQTDAIVAVSPQMREVLELVEALADTEVTVLIRGESGTGKELVARAIHDRGSRRYYPLVPVNCGALPEQLLETELFGHEKGAFTGAHQRRKGKLEQADGGTLFLDEVGSISPKTQVELLRVLESKEFTRIGGQKPVRVDFRVVCATNQDLEELVEAKLFREDLYFRINVFRVDLPPLRERPEDIPVLVEHFVERFSRQLNKRVTGVSPQAMELLQHHPWPGNVRELGNAVERAVFLSKEPTLQAHDLPLLPPTTESGQPGDSLAEVEKAHIARILRRCGGNISQAAKVLGVDRATLYNKIKKYELRT